MAKELLRNAAKARIARMVAPKRKRTDLEVPDFIRNSGAKVPRQRKSLQQPFKMLTGTRLGPLLTKPLLAHASHSFSHRVGKDQVNSQCQSMRLESPSYSGRT